MATKEGQSGSEAACSSCATKHELHSCGHCKELYCESCLLDHLKDSFNTEVASAGKRWADEVDPKIESVTNLISGLDAFVTEKKAEIGRNVDDVIHELETRKNNMQWQLEDWLSRYKEQLTDLLNQLRLPKTTINALHASTSQNQGWKQACSTESLLDSILVLEKLKEDANQVGSTQISTEPGVGLLVKCNMLMLERAFDEFIEVVEIDTGDDVVDSLDADTQANIDELQSVVERYWSSMLSQHETEHLTETAQKKETDSRSNKRKPDTTCSYATCEKKSLIETTPSSPGV